MSRLTRTCILPPVELLQQVSRLAARNLHKVDVLDAAGVDPVSLIGFDKVLVTVPALKKLEGMLA